MNEVAPSTIEDRRIQDRSSQDQNVRLYMFLRLVMLFSVLISVIIYQQIHVMGPATVSKTYYATFFTFLVTTAFIFLYEKTSQIRYFLTSQIAYDVLFTTFLIFYTGQ